MGELDGNGTVQFGRRVAAFAKVAVNDKQVITRTVDVIEAKVDADHIGRTVVLNAGTGEPLAAEGKVDAVVNLVKADRVTRFQADSVEGVAQFG